MTRSSKSSAPSRNHASPESHGTIGATLLEARVNSISHNVRRFMTPREPSVSSAEGCPALFPSYPFWCLRR